MQIEKEDLDWAVDQDLIDANVADSLWQALLVRKQHVPKFDFANVSYYFGALIVIFGMFFFLTLAWESLGGKGIFAISCIYILIFAMAGRHLWFERGLKVPAGLLTTIAVCMVPLAIYGFQRMTGIWPYGDPGSYRNYWTVSSKIVQ